MNDILFRGYVKTRNKKCTQRFANGEPLLSFEEASNLDEYAGILADNIILIDIDDDVQSEILMKTVEDLQLNCRVYKTTRGRHFYFMNSGVKKCATKTKLACGLTADIKLGCKNSYAVLRYSGKDRFVEWDNVDDTLDPLPVYLQPVKSNIDLVSMEKGDGRNQALFGYILSLQGQGFSKEDIRSILTLINDHIFKEPLPKKELATIMRDDAFVPPEALLEDPQRDTDDSMEFFTSKGQFLFDKFAKFLLTQYEIIKVNKQLLIYKDGIYMVGHDIIEAEMIKHISNLNKQKRNEVLSYLELLVPEDDRPSDTEFIAFRNGIYNIDTDDFMDFNKSIIITNKINYNYVPDAYSEIADKTLDKLSCYDPQIRSLLEEVIGYTFFRRNELRKAFILVGDKSNGKSTYLNMICQLLGSDNTTALDLKELGDRFKTAELFGKLANIGDDIGDEFIPNPAIFKKVVSGDRVNAERKGQDPFDFSPYAKQLFSANSIPRIKDKSGAVLDRLVIVPFEATFSKDDPDFDPYIKYKLRDDSVMEYLIQIGLKGLKRVLDHQAFTICKKIEDRLEEYAENNNPTLMFFKESTDSEIFDKPTKFVYQAYVEFCFCNSLQPLSNIEFSRQVKKYYQCDIVIGKVNGKSYRMFKKT